MIWSLRAWRRRRTLARHPLRDGQWARAVDAHEFLDGLDPEELVRLRELVTLFVHEKAIEGAGGLVLTDAMKIAIAIQACILVLNLGLASYDGWSEVIVYPEEFVPQIEWTDEDGVVHSGRDIRSGESWLGGPVILAWSEVRDGRADGVNVVIHEFAHKLDMLNGDANGFPPLHAGMSREAWARAFGDAYRDFRARVDLGRPLDIDPYAAESPAEFFAVISEMFFEMPVVVRDTYPEVYGQLAAFYRQDPLARRARRAHGTASARA